MVTANSTLSAYVGEVLFLWVVFSMHNPHAPSDGRVDHFLLTLAHKSQVFRERPERNLTRGKSSRAAAIDSDSA